jgi:hypothetical protein
MLTAQPMGKHFRLIARYRGNQGVCKKHYTPVKHCEYLTKPD